MTREAFRELVKNGPVLLDGATGTNLQKAGMPVGVCPEQWILENSEVLIDLQKRYVEAGTDILFAPTFTASRIKLKEYGLEDHLEEMNRKLVALSKEAAKGTNALVAGDLTMTGEQLYPLGDLMFEDLVDVYKEQAKIIAEAGADLFVVETMMSLQECRAAVLAIREVCDLPVMVSLTYNEDGRTLYGTDPVTAVVVMQSLGADAVGMNCSTGPEAMLEPIAKMAEYAAIPLLAKPNAGMPELIDGQTVIGAKPIFLAEIARHPVDALSDSARFLTYGMVKIFGTAGMALAFYRTAKPENKQRLKVTLIPLIVTSVLVGITEPFEFLFIFTAPLLWLIYSLLDGFFQMLAWLLHVRVCATNGLIDFVVYNLPAGVSATRWPVFVALGLLETATMYLVGTFCITRLRLLTPGRETAAEDEHSQQANSEHPDKGALVIAGLGGKENVCAVGNCFTRLRVDVRDPALIQQTLLKESGGSSVLIKGNHVQVIYGLGVNKIRTAVNASLGVIE